MKMKLLAIFSSVLVVCAGLTSCSHARTDAQITADVQQRIQAETALKPAPIQVQANNGVVVLSGSVPSEAARSLAEKTANQANGVKGVVNNLQVVTAAAVPANLPPIARQQVPARKPAAAKRAVKTPSPPATAQPEVTQSQATAAKPVAIPVTIPEGTAISVRLIDQVDTAKHKEGDTFRASLDAPIIIADKIIIPKNSDVTARLASAKSAGHFTGSSAVVLVLDTITVGGKSYSVQTGEFTKQGGSRGKRSAAVIGGGAAAGALIAALSGGGKGAAIGAAAGAGAGTGVQALTKGEQIKLPAETLLEFELKAPLTVMPAGEETERETIG